MPAERTTWGQDLMVQLQDRKIEAPTVLRHRQVNPVFVYLLPLQGEHLGFAKAGKQQHLIEHPMDWVLQTVDY